MVLAEVVDIKATTPQITLIMFITLAQSGGSGGGGFGINTSSYWGGASGISGQGNSGGTGKNDTGAGTVVLVAAHQLGILLAEMEVLVQALVMQVTELVEVLAVEVELETMLVVLATLVLVLVEVMVTEMQLPPIEVAEVERRAPYQMLLKLVELVVLEL